MVRGTATSPNSIGFLLVLLLVSAGCAEQIGIATQQDLTQLRDDLSRLQQDVTAVRTSLQRSRSEAESRTQADRELREQQAETQRQLAQLSSRTEGLASELKRVSARLEELSQRLEQRTRQPGPPASQPFGPRTGQGPTTSPPPTGPRPTEVYQTAYLDFSKGNYALAITGFREFIRRFPDSPLAETAQYLIGEAYFSQASAHATKAETEQAQRAFEQAVQEFRKVTLDHPRGEKVPPALYKEALALLELKRRSLARARLQYLLDHFPQSEEAPLARERLAGLKETG